MTTYCQQWVPPDNSLKNRDRFFVEYFSESIRQLQNIEKTLDLEFDFSTLEIVYDESIDQYPARVILEIQTK